MSSFSNNPALAPTAASASAPLLSVIIPALRVDLELRRCVESVQLALPPDHPCEIVVVLPASQVEAAGALGAVRVVAERRRGVYGAMNEGVSASSGQYLYFLGKDDILLPSVRDALAVLAASRPDALFCDVYWGDAGVRSCKPVKWLVLFNNVCQQGILYSRQSVLRHGPFLRRLRVQADHLLNIKMLWDPALGRVQYLRKPLAWYAATGLSAVVRDATFYRIHPAVVRRYLGPVVAWMWHVYIGVRQGPPKKERVA